MRKNSSVQSTNQHVYVYNSFKPKLKCSVSVPEQTWIAKSILMQFIIEIILLWIKFRVAPNL